MTSPFTATDARTPRTEAVPDRIGELSEGAHALEHLRPSEAVYADFFAEVHLETLEDARVRTRGARLQPATFRTRTHRTSGYSVRAFRRNRHCLVSVPFGASATPEAAVEELRRLLRHRSDDVQCALHLEEEAAASIAAPAVHLRAWDRFLLAQVSDAAFSADERVAEVRVRRQSTDRARVVSPRNCDRLPIHHESASLRIDVLLRADGRAWQGSAFGVSNDHLDQLARQAVNDAAERATAKPVGQEYAAVVFAGGWGSMWVHEAVGHLLEADTLADAAALPDALPELSVPLTVCDDPRLPDGRGSFTHDDEGTPGMPTVLLSRGAWTARRMSDRFHAYASGTATTGNARRSSYRDLPAPRMSNLDVANGPAAPEDLLARAEGGVFVAGLREGCFLRDQNALQLLADPVYRIRDGRPAERLAEIRLRLGAHELLSRIREIGNDASMDASRGVCVKHHQPVPVSVRAPSVLVDPLPIEPAA